MSVGYVFRALASALPADAVVVEESVSSRAAFYDQIRIERTSSYFATGSVTTEPAHTRWVALTKSAGLAL